MTSIGPGVRRKGVGGDTPHICVDLACLVMVGDTDGIGDTGVLQYSHGSCFWGVLPLL